MAKGFKPACPQCLITLHRSVLVADGNFLVCPRCGYQKRREICRHCGHSKREGEQRCTNCNRR